MIDVQNWMSQRFSEARRFETGRYFDVAVGIISGVIAPTKFEVRACPYAQSTYTTNHGPMAAMA